MPASTQSATGAIGKFTVFARSKKGLATIIALVAVAVLAVGGSTWGYQAMANDVTMTVDGEERQISSHADTVGEVLEEEGIEVGQHDRVAPDEDTELSDGSAISVQYGRQLTLEVDGKSKTYWVTSRSVDRALNEIERNFGDRAEFSTSRSAEIGRDGMTLEVVTPKKVTVVLGGKKAQKKTVTALTVQEALKELGVKLEKRDSVRPKAGKKLQDGDKIVFTDVSTKTKRVKAESVDYETVERSDDSMYTDEEETVREGRDGTRDVTYRLVYRNGEVVERKVLKANVTREPVDEVVKVGTKERPEPEPEPAGGSATGSAPSGTVWASLAQCESGGNPNAVNPAGPYYGLYQFTASTWQSVGGSGIPTDHSAAEQTKRAKILQARSGWGQWPACAAELGLL